MKPTPEKRAFVKSLIDNFGIVAAACDATGTTRDQFDTWMKEDEQFAIGYASLIESSLNAMEVRFAELLKRGEPNAIVLYLQTHGESRGYGKIKDV